ncbi:MAG: ASPIC and UnbV [Planctomycetota bacterium]|nr:MAG: ASPIC and UnbV [Planctomycetota bacterium]
MALNSEWILNSIRRTFPLAQFLLAGVLVGCGEREKVAPESKVPPEIKSEVPPSRPFAFTAVTAKPIASLSVAVPKGIAFADVAQERGLKYVWPQQPRPMTALDAFGAGCAAFDADNDGWQDVLLIGDPTPALFRNLGDGRFEDLTAASGLKAVSGHWTGCAIGDFDGDGLLDVLLTGYHQLALFKNLGQLRFQEVTATAGLDLRNQGYWGASAGFMDLDGDQWLDLVILNYVVYGPDSKKYCEYAPGVRSGCAPRSYPPEQGQIWRNNGSGRFELVPTEQGMQQTHGVGLVLAFSDLDEASPPPTTVVRSRRWERTGRTSIAMGCWTSRSPTGKEIRSYCFRGWDSDCSWIARSKPSWLNGRRTAWGLVPSGLISRTTVGQTCSSSTGTSTTIRQRFMGRASHSGSRCLCFGTIKAGSLSTLFRNLVRTFIGRWSAEVRRLRTSTTTDESTCWRSIMRDQ